MKNSMIPTLVVTAFVSGLGMTTPVPSQAEDLLDIEERHPPQRTIATAENTPEASFVFGKDDTLTQLFYPPLSERQGLMVVGKGEVSGPADQAKIELSFSQSDDSSEAIPSLTLAPVQYESEAAPLTSENLKPILDAIAAVGIPESAIEIKTAASCQSSPWFPFPCDGSGGAVVMVTLPKPSREQVKQVVTAAEAATDDLDQVLMTNVSVTYSVNDCQSLEIAAYQAAIRDARKRAQAMAEAMEAELDNHPSVAEPFYSIFYPGCGSAGGTFPFNYSTPAYDPSAPAEVKVTRDVFVTYPVK